MELSLYLLLILAAILANLPFVLPRFVGFFRIANSDHKPVVFILFELMLGFAFLLFAGFMFESFAGGLYSKSWTFFVVMFFLFLVMAYPGFVYRFFWRKPGL
jgi:hypothetical protein